MVARVLACSGFDGRLPIERDAGNSGGRTRGDACGHDLIDEPSPAMHVRAMTAADLQVVRDIFNDAVATTTAIWSETPRSEAEQVEWFEQKRAGNWPCLVAVDSEANGGAVLGYAALGPFRPQPGFRRTGEHAVYVAAAARRRGVGRALVAAIQAAAVRRGLRVVIAAVSADNPASLTLHEGLGFREVGRLPNVGEKWGRDLTAVFLQWTP